MPPGRAASIALNVLAALALGSRVRAQDATPPAEPLRATRISSPITVDGALDEPAWQGVPKVEAWYETNPGDNTPPRVKNVGYLAYDEGFFYAGFEFHDDDPSSIRAPYGDRDTIGSPLDYGGVILDTRNTRRTAILFLANPRGIQYDAVTDDSSGEDSSPDFYWDSAARITDTGWTLEIRIPFSSLRYPKADPQTWGVMLYRNYPREFRYQYFTTRIPKNSSCFICRSSALGGLQGLPSSGGVVVAPYATATQQWVAPDPPDGRLHTSPFDGDGGVDVKWRPGANTALDGTVNPDFSQIESDVAQIAANERFALFFPEKRPFFLEGIELFSTPIQAVYTRTITSPRWGVRGTGKLGALAYTALAAEDRGGGSVILPGALASDLADQDFRSWVGMARVKRFFGGSFLGALAVDRELDGRGWNRVFGPDFQWRGGGGRDTVTGQLLLSRSLTPQRTDLAEEWDGRRLDGHAGQLWWYHSTKHLDWTAQYTDIADGFRADSGFVPQVGYRQLYGDAGVTRWPQGFLRRQRVFTTFDRQVDRGGDLVQQLYTLGTGLDARWDTFLQFRYHYDRIRTGARVLPRHSGNVYVESSPTRHVNQISVEARFGDQIDFDNERLGSGLNLTFNLNVRPTDHINLSLNNSRRFLNVNDPALGSGRLFTARVDRLRATYTFNARSFLRVIAQWVETRREPSLYTFDIERRSASFGGSALFAYKLNWQTVLFLGYGDNRELAEITDSLEPADRSLFMKLSYAFQR